MTPPQTASSADTTLVRKLNSLLEVSKALGAEARLDSLLAVIVAKATEVMEAERSSLFIYNESSETLSTRASADIAQGGVRVPLGLGIVGHVARTLETVNIPDAYADPRFHREVDLDTGFRTRALLAAPLLTNSGRLIGVIEVLNKVGGETFNDEDERYLAAFASIAGIALERSRLVEASLEKEKIETALRLAHDIQLGMLPKEFPSRPDLDMNAFLRPARSVGGDLYDFVLTGDDLWFMVGDVSGKGVPAALFMAVAKALFGASVESETSAAGVASRMNRGLCRCNEQSLFVSAFLGRLDLVTGELEFANAGSNRPYHLRPDGRAARIDTSPSLVLGLMEGQAYGSERVVLEPGDGFFVYTDGITEAINESEDAFSYERLEECLTRGAGWTAQAIVASVVGAVDAFAGEAPQYDDITALAIRYGGG